MDPGELYTHLEMVALLRQWLQEKELPTQYMFIPFEGHNRRWTDHERTHYNTLLYQAAEIHFRDFEALATKVIENVYYHHVNRLDDTGLPRMNVGQSCR